MKNSNFFMYNFIIQNKIWNLGLIVKVIFGKFKILFAVRGFFVLKIFKFYALWRVGVLKMIIQKMKFYTRIFVYVPQPSATPGPAQTVAVKIAIL